MRSRWVETAERGSVTAEFAVALPAVVLVLAMVLGGIQAGAVLVRATDASAQAARAAARGDEQRARGAVAAVLPHAVLHVEREDAGLVCARVAVPVHLLGLPGGLVVEARSCALGGGL